MRRATGRGSSGAPSSPCSCRWPALVGALALAPRSRPAGPAAPPTTTALIEQRRAEARAAGPPLPAAPGTGSRSSGSRRRLVDAVVASEDATLLRPPRLRLGRARGGRPPRPRQRGRYARGASTITQQLAKNLCARHREEPAAQGPGGAADRPAGAAPRQAADPGALPQRGRVGRRRLRRRGRRPPPLRRPAPPPSPRPRRCCWPSMLPAPRRADLAPAPTWLAARARGLLHRLRDEQVIPAAGHAVARAELEGYLGGSAGGDPGRGRRGTASRGRAGRARAGPRGRCALPCRGGAAGDPDRTTAVAAATGAGRGATPCRPRPAPAAGRAGPRARRGSSLSDRHAALPTPASP